MESSRTSTAQSSQPAIGNTAPQSTLSSEGQILSQSASQQSQSSRSGNTFLTYSASQDPNPVLTLNASRAHKSEVFEIIKDRLQNAGVRTEQFTEASSRYILPGPRALKEEWDMFLQDPHLVDDAILTRILRLQKSTSLTIENDTLSYYIRTFIFRLFELQLVIMELKARGYGYHTRLQAIEDSVGELEEEQMVYIRYAGMSERGALHRHQEDLVSTHGGSFAIEFIQITMQFLPEVIRQAQVQELPEAEISPFQDHTPETDIREQAIIAFLGAGCLNTSDGGHWTCIDDDEDAYDIYSGYIAYVARRVTNHPDAVGEPLHPAPAPMVTAITQYATSVQAYTDTHPITTNTHTLTFTNELKQVVIDQLVPNVLSAGWGTCCLIGSDIPQTTMRNPSVFMEQEINTAQNVRNGFIQIASWEESTTVLNDQAMAILNRPGSNTFAFCDLDPWPAMHPSDDPAASRLLRSAVRGGNFCITVPMGTVPTAFALGNFLAPTGLRRDPSNFLDVVGLPHVVKYCEPGVMSTQSDWTLCIPMVHTGAISRRGGSRALHRLTTLTLMVVYIALYEFMKLSTPNSNKYQSCKAVAATMAIYLASTERLGSELAAARKAASEDLEATRATNPQTVEAKRRRDDDRLARRIVAAELGFIRLERSDGQNEAERLRLVRFTKDQFLDRSHAALFKEIQRAERRDLSPVEWSRILADDFVRYRRWLNALQELSMIMACGTIAPRTGFVAQAKQILEGGLRLLDDFSAQFRTQTAVQLWLEQQVTDTPLYFASDSKTRIKPESDFPSLLRCLLKVSDITADPNATVDADTFQWHVRPDVLQTVSSRVQDLVVDIFEQGADMAGITNIFFARMKTIDPRAYSCHERHNEQRLQLETRKLDGSGNLSGNEVFIRASGEDNIPAGFMFTFTDGQGAIWQTPFLRVATSCIPASERDLRIMIFERTGIAVTTWDRERLGIRPGTHSTVPLHTLVANAVNSTRGQALVALWERQTGVSAQDAMDQPVLPTLVEGPGVIPESFFESFGRPVEYTHRASGEVFEREDLAQSRLPITPNHELWLWARFFEDMYPGAASVRTDPDYQGCAWNKLLVFLPRYIHHPYQTKLLGLAHQARQRGNAQRTSSRKLGMMAKLLRHPVATDQNIVNGTCYNIGPSLFTGLLDPSAPVAPLVVEDDISEATQVLPMFLDEMATRYPTQAAIDSERWGIYNSQETEAEFSWPPYSWRPITAPKHRQPRAPETRQPSLAARYDATHDRSMRHQQQRLQGVASQDLSASSVPTASSTTLLSSGLPLSQSVPAGTTSQPMQQNAPSAPATQETRILPVAPPNPAQSGQSGAFDPAPPSAQPAPAAPWSIQDAPREPAAQRSQTTSRGPATTSSRGTALPPKTPLRRTNAIGPLNLPPGFRESPDPDTLPVVAGGAHDSRGQGTRHGESGSYQYPPPDTYRGGDRGGEYGRGTGGGYDSRGQGTQHRGSSDVQREPSGSFREARGSEYGRDRGGDHEQRGQGTLRRESGGVQREPSGSIRGDRGSEYGRDTGGGYSSRDQGTHYGESGDYQYPPPDAYRGGNRGSEYGKDRGSGHGQQQGTRFSDSRANQPQSSVSYRGGGRGSEYGRDRGSDYGQQQGTHRGGPGDNQRTASGSGGYDFGTDFGGGSGDFQGFHAGGTGQGGRGRGDETRRTPAPVAGRRRPRRETRQEQEAAAAQRDARRPRRDSYRPPETDVAI